MLLSWAVFGANAAIDFFATRWQTAVRLNQLGRAVVWGVCLNSAIAMDAMGLVTARWAMLPWIIAGGALGTCLAIPQPLIALARRVRLAIFPGALF